MVGHHEVFRRDEAATGSSDRAFGIVFASVFALIGFWPLLDGAWPRLWALAVAAAFAAVAAVYPVMLAPLNRLWFHFGQLLHRIVNPLVMAVLFYLVIVPTGLAMRACRRRPLKLAYDPAASSYWIERSTPAAETMRNQY